MPITARYMAAQHVARRAGQLAHDLFANHKALNADDNSPDEHFAHGARAISALITSKLAAAFPADVFMDEHRPSIADADRLWVIEAIGGEHNFKRDIPFYSIAIAYAERGYCETAIVYDPERDEMFHALRNQGAWCEHGGRENRLEVSRCSELEQALISIALDDRTPDPTVLPLRRELIDAGAAARVLGAPALELAHVAAGRLDGFVGLGLDPFNLMGALLLVQEAGGYTSHLPADGGMRSTVPVIGCTPNIGRSLNTISEAWNTEGGLEPPLEMPTSAQGLGHRARARRPAA
jgi:myo-inositol-1(or 4)-monophosphatase